MRPYLFPCLYTLHCAFGAYSLKFKGSYDAASPPCLYTLHPTLYTAPLARKAIRLLGQYIIRMQSLASLFISLPPQEVLISLCSNDLLRCTIGAQVVYVVVIIIRVVVFKIQRLRFGCSLIGAPTSFVSEWGEEKRRQPQRAERVLSCKPVSTRSGGNLFRRT